MSAERARGELRVVHFSVQGNHVHLVVEANDRETLSRRMQGLGVRLARAINAMMHGRRGPVLAHRYHARVLGTPREVHRVIAYVLTNHAKHAAQAGRTAPRVDRFASVSPFTHPAENAGTGPPLVSTPSTWLLRGGWRRSIDAS